MKVYEILFLFNKQLEESQGSDTYKYIKTAYNNVINKITEKYDMDTNLHKSDIDELNITLHMKNKLKSILSQKITKVDKAALKKSRLYNEITNIPGIGAAKANELIKLGLTNINQLSKKKWESYLTSSTIFFLKNKPLKKIPNSMIKYLEPLLTGYKNAKITLVGGYIRKKPFSKDIDVMLISEKPALIQYIEYLKKKFPMVYIYSQGPDKASLVVKHPEQNIFLKIDIFVTQPKYQHAMLLYAIGSKTFNIRMRRLANTKGYLLNQYGLFKLPIDKDNPENNKPVKVNSEKDFFKILEIPYVIPEKR